MLDLCDLVQDVGAQPVRARVADDDLSRSLCSLSSLSYSSSSIFLSSCFFSSCVSEEPCRQYIYILPCDMYV
jgi:hypothetical protein